MGLIKAIVGAAGGVLSDQWNEYFYCDAMEADVLVQKGQKRISGRSTNRHGENNIISNGSTIAVADGQCMIIVEQGKIVEVCAEPGTFVYDTSSEPSIFTGDLGTSIKETFKNIGKRFTFGGSPGNDQRVYYFNTKEIMGNKYGTVNPITYKFVDEYVGIKLAMSLKCNGEYSYRIIDPILFYTNVCGNVEDEYRRSSIDSQLRSELIGGLMPAFGQFASKGMDYTDIPLHAMELADILNNLLSEKWSKLRGIT
ncbi:MAG: SPFH domain-containing protein, partial [Abditibacteriota bacterium]|nr:SPFH domain-containing protein [Abditibacteriota bacterium]